MTINPAQRPARRSAFPPDVTDLMPAARQLAAELDATPSRNALMAALHVGAPKARAVLAHLTGQPATRPLHLVTDHADPPADPHTVTDDHQADEHDQADEDQVDEDQVDEDQVDEDQVDEDQVDEDQVDDQADEQAVTDDPPAGTPEATTPPAEPPPGKSKPTAASPAPAAEKRRIPVWPVLLLTLPALAAIWSGWVGLGGMAGFGVVHPLPGIADHLTFNTAITLPIGVEVYAAYALYAWLSGALPDEARKFARTSAVVSLFVGAAGQVTYHLLTATHVHHAPWPVVTLVACLPVAVLGMGAALAHLVRNDH